MVKLIQTKFKSVKLTETTVSLHQFCKTVRRLLLSRRVAKAAAMLGVCLIIWVGTVTVYSVFLAVLLPFLIWMAS